jgi:hypothetical protein
LKERRNYLFVPPLLFSLDLAFSRKMLQNQ